MNDWIVSESKSPIDDSPTVTMFRIAESGGQSLVLRCKENTTDAYIRTDDFLGDDSTNVTVRYDSNKAQKLKLSLSTNNKALFFSPAITNIKQMLMSKKIIIRYHTYSGTPNTVAFNLDNLKEKIGLLNCTQNWPFKSSLSLVKKHNNHMHADSEKHRSFLALLFAAGDAGRWAHEI